MSGLSPSRAGLRTTLWVALTSLSPAAGAFAAVPELPRTTVDTTYPARTGTVIAVLAGGDLQLALDDADLGDVITLEAGATFTGPFTLRAKSGTGWIVVRTSAPDSSLPPAGSRITPTHAPLLPKLVSPDSGPAVRTDPGAHHYRLVGLEVVVAPGVLENDGLVLLGDGSDAQSQLADVPERLVLDRVYIHGNPDVGLRRGVALNSATSAVIDSHISDVHHGTDDSQAIAGWNGPGPFKIANNYLEGAAENVMFGGADPFIFELVPSDIEILGNHFFKPLSWRIDDPSYAGTEWSVKNLFELKNARRVLVEGNVFENSWGPAQSGFAIVFTVRNQQNTAPWSVVEDVTFRLNIVRHAGSAMNILGTDDTHTSEQTKRILIRDNLFEDIDGEKWGGSGRLFLLLDGTLDVTIDHNTAFHTDAVIFAESESQPHDGFVYSHNLTAHNASGVAGTGTATGTDTLNTHFSTGYVFARNVLMGGDADVYPAPPPDNFFPATWEEVKFVDLAGGDYRLADDSPFAAGGGMAGTDGEDLGADIEALLAATAGAIVPPARRLQFFRAGFHQDEDFERLARAHVERCRGVRPRGRQEEAAGL